jgi:hypothetical protein
MFLESSVTIEGLIIKSRYFDTRIRRVVATVIKATSSHSIEYLKTKIHGDRQYFLNANAI